MTTANVIEHKGRKLIIEPGRVTLIDVSQTTARGAQVVYLSEELVDVMYEALHGARQAEVA